MTLTQLTAQIYCAENNARMINDSYLEITDTQLIEKSKEVAQKILEATYQPLEWKPLRNKHFSKGNEFYIVKHSENSEYCYLIQQSNNEKIEFGLIDDLKKIAEHLRTR